MLQPIIPLLHYSNTPVLFEGPLFQAFVIRVTTDPFSALLIVEEWDTATVALVVIAHQFSVRFIVPDLQLCHFDPGFIFQPLHERFHRLAVGSLRTGEL